MTDKKPVVQPVALMTSTQLQGIALMSRYQALADQCRATRPAMDELAGGISLDQVNEIVQLNQLFGGLSDDE